MFLKDFNEYAENLKLYGGNAGRKLGIDIDGEPRYYQLEKDCIC